MYESKMLLHRKVKYKLITSGWAEGEKEEHLVSENQITDKDYLVFRTRTRRDAEDHVISCHYSKTLRAIGFTGGRIRMEWRTNPTPNDTNLEDDPKNRYDPEAIRAKQELEEENRLARVQRQRLDELMARHKALSDSPFSLVLYTVDVFLLNLAYGYREAIVPNFLADSQEQKDHVKEYLDETIPRFLSGKTRGAVAPVAFAFGDFAIVPMRLWPTENPENLEMKGACVVKPVWSDSWLLLPDFEHPEAAINGLDETALKAFSTLKPMYEKYRDEKMAERKNP
jgi:hypothetical protein